MSGRRFAGRKIEERIARALMLAAFGLVALALLSILLMIGIKGIPSLSLQMLIRTPQGGYYLGREGGILNAIVGSLLVSGAATALALAASVPVALYLNVYVRPRSRFARAVDAAADILWGIPSIVYGVFGFLVMLALGVKASLGAAIFTVALFEAPILLRAAGEVLRGIPPELKEASLGLGATRLQTAFRVVARQAVPGLVTATLMAFGRGVGDTASVLFTAGFSDRIPTGLGQPAATLPLAIFFQLGTPFPEVQARAYAAAVVLTALVLAVSLAARRWGRRLSRFTLS